MAERPVNRWQRGDVVALRYITTDGRIEMCWPCRVVADDEDLIALFIAAGSPYKAGPKRTAAEKRIAPRPALPPDEYIWRKDTLRLMLPGRAHSVSLFWEKMGDERAFSRYFFNMEEPFRRTSVGFDTQDHTLDIDVTPELKCSWRDEDELRHHVNEGFYTEALAQAARAEGQAVIEEIAKRRHACLNGWNRWAPDSVWQVPGFPDGWGETAPTFWDRRDWAYGPAAGC